MKTKYTIGQTVYWVYKRGNLYRTGLPSQVQQIKITYDNILYAIKYVAGRVREKDLFPNKQEAEDERMKRNIIIELRK